MRNLFWLKLLVAFSAGTLYAGTIQVQVTALDASHYQYDYFVSGVTFQVNEGLNIRFDPALYDDGSLSIGIAPADFVAFLNQPNNPPGIFGDYIALSLIDNPSITGPFRVIVTSGAAPSGAQPYFLNQYDENGSFISTVDAGFVSLAEVGGDPPAPAPEPSSLTLISAAVFLAGGRAARRLRKPKRQSSGISTRVVR